MHKDLFYVNILRLYTSIGAAFGNFKYYTPSIGTALGAPASYSKSALPALLLGAGGEVALTNKLSFRGEYQWLDYETWTITTPIPLNPSAVAKLNQKSNQFIASLLYHFR